MCSSQCRLTGGSLSGRRKFQIWSTCKTLWDPFYKSWFSLEAVQVSCLSLVTLTTYCISLFILFILFLRWSTVAVPIMHGTRAVPIVDGTHGTHVVAVFGKAPARMAATQRARELRVPGNSTWRSDSSKSVASLIVFFTDVMYLFYRQVFFGILNQKT